MSIFFFFPPLPPPTPVIFLEEEDLAAVIEKAFIFFLWEGEEKNKLNELFLQTDLWLQLMLWDYH